MTDAGFTPDPTLKRLYPEAAVGGYSRTDGQIEFYTRINALVDEKSRVLDFGAGRGQWAVDPMPQMSGACGTARPGGRGGRHRRRPGRHRNLPSTPPRSLRSASRCRSRTPRSTWSWPTTCSSTSTRERRDGGRRHDARAQARRLVRRPHPQQVGDDRRRLRARSPTGCTSECSPGCSPAARPRTSSRRATR